MKGSKKANNLVRSLTEYLISIGAFVLVWQIYVSVADVPEFVLPGPVSVFSEFVDIFATGMVWPHLLVTSLEVVLGFVIGAFGGIVIGYLFVKIDFIKTAFMPYLIFIQTAPKIALVPLFVVWFGIGLLSKVVLIISMVVFPVMAGMVLGIDSMPADARNLMKVLKSSRWQLFSKVEMMYSLPALFSGMKIGIVQAVIGAIVAEWMSGKQGLGYILTYASSTYDTPLLIAGITVTIILGVLTYEAIGVCENRWLYWHESKQYN